MKRRYYVSDDLGQLEKLQVELERNGVKTEQIHILSENDAYMNTHNMNAVDPIAKKDMIKSGLIGLAVGVIGAVIILFLSYQFGVNERVTWAPAVFLAVAFVGFSTWEGGMWGIHKPNRDFARFEKLLKSGKHVFFIDLKEDQEAVLKQTMAAFPNLKSAGPGHSTPLWFIGWQKLVRQPH